MDFELPADDDPRRLTVRTWLAEHPRRAAGSWPRPATSLPHWPKPWGLGADPIQQA